jgi:nicotinate-nucleotide adenylyltransferase
MRVGLFFGSFNPIHHGHLIVATHVCNAGLVDQVWFIVSPLNPFKQKNDLMNEYTRLNLLSLAIDGMSKFKVSDIEFKLPRPSYTIDTLDKLKAAHPHTEFFLILGGDSFQNLSNWKDGHRILKEFKILVYQRKGYDVIGGIGESVNMIEAPVIEISSTMIRSLIRKGSCIRYYLPEKVREEIERSGLYKK